MGSNRSIAIRSRGGDSAGGGIEHVEDIAEPVENNKHVPNVKSTFKFTRIILKETR